MSSAVVTYLMLSLGMKLVTALVLQNQLFSGLSIFFMINVKI